MARALQIDFLLNGITDNSGEPLAAGKVYTYSAGTLTNKATYTDAAATTPATNPIILDAYGRATIFGSGAYKFVIKTSTDSTIQTIDNVNYFIQNDVDAYGSTSTGSSNTYAITVSNIYTAYAAGQEFSFIAHQTNTSTATLNVNALGAKSIKTPKGNALNAGQIPINRLIKVIYDGTDFILISPDRGVLTDWTPTLGASGSMTLTSTTITYAKYMMGDGFYDFTVSFSGTTGGTASTAVSFTLPITPASTDGDPFTCAVLLAGSLNAGVAFVNSGSTVYCRRQDASNFALAASMGANVSGRVYI